MNILILYLLLLLATIKFKELDDDALAHKIKESDHQAFKEFFDRYHAYLLNFLLKRGTPEETAQDLVQQAFVLIWEKRAEIDPDKSIRSYLFRIAYTRMLNVFRDENKFDKSTPIEASVEPEEVEIAGEQKSVTIKNAIESAIQQMPTKRQEVFRLCYIQEFTYKEAAQVLDISVKTVENHIGLALKDLRAQLKDLKERI